MHQSPVCVAILCAICPGPAIAQAGAPQGRVDISNSDMGPHDSATQPSNLDVIRNGIRNDEADKRAKFLRDKLGPARAAQARDLTAGAAVNDNQGALIATIVSIDPGGVVVSAGTAKIKVPANAFGRNRVGLLLDMTKAQFDAMVAKANSGS